MGTAYQSGEVINGHKLKSLARRTAKHSYWLIECSCGRERVARTDRFNRGCFCAVSRRQRQDRGGQSRTPTYVSWAAMFHRCYVRTHASFKYYGERGIKVCDRWQDFLAFLEDMGPRPSGLSLDRIDPNGHYEPGNCRWASARTQILNRRKRKAE